MRNLNKMALSIRKDTLQDNKERMEKQIIKLNLRAGNSLYRELSLPNL